LPLDVRPGRGSAPLLSEAPGAESSDALSPQSLVPAQWLDGGEIIILAVKPSLWFVVFKSARWLAGALAAILATVWVEPEWLPVRDTTVIQACVALAFARVGLALLAWVSRLYVLTNRRIMRITGIFNIDLFECQLTRIQSTFLTIAWYERPFSVGTISFATAAAGGVEVHWTHVNHPLEIHEQVRAAIHRAQRPGNGV
jgi:hypothetical protein